MYQNINVQAIDKMIAVKEERPDEAEIKELAAKMVEANRLKMAGAGAVSNFQRPSIMTGSGGQVSIMSYTNRAGPSKAPVTLPEEKKPIDEDSQKGRFGWVTLGPSVPIPYIIRHGERYCAVRMVELKLLNKYLSYLHSDIYSYTNIRSYYITDAEARVLNEINVRHCDGHFGREHFIANKDVVVRLQDASEFHSFLDICYNKLNFCSSDPKDRCGFIRINNESVVPYTLKDSIKFVPLFYFEGETDSLKLKAVTLEGWDLAYLKFCCKVQGIRNELFASETCSVISLDDIKSYFPTGTVFDDYWPTKMVDCQLLAKNPVGYASWTRQPAGAPHPQPVAVAAKPVSSHQRTYSSAMTPPIAGTPNSQASLPTNVMNGWAMHQQNNMARMAQVQQASLSPGMQNSANNVQYNPAMRAAWGSVVHGASGSAPYYNYAQVPQMTMQHHQQKSHPPPLVRAQHATEPSMPTLTGPGQLAMNESRQYAQMQKNHGQTRAAAVHSTAPTRYARYGTDEMNMNGAQQQSVLQQYAVNGNGRVTAMPAKDSTKKVQQIADVPVTGTHTPYQVQKALIESKMVPSINMKPYQYSELLMTLTDLVSHFFPSTSLYTLMKALQEALNITLYRPNRQQIEVLRQAGKCRADKDVPMLIQVQSVMTYMPQLKYILMNQNKMAMNEAKRQKIS